METQGIEAATGLLNYGVLGIMAVLFLGAIVFLQRQNTANVKLLMEAKDKEISYWKEQANKHDNQIDTILAQLTSNGTRLLDLLEGQKTEIKEIPVRTVEQFRLMDHK